MFKNIVVAVDGSDHATRALQVACDLAKHYDSQVHIAHTPQLETVAYALGHSAVEVKPSQEQVQAAGKAVIDKAIETAESMQIKPASTTIGNGTPSQEAVQAVKKNNADLIIVGRRGLGGLSSMLLGSTSQRIGHDADCAVMTVK